MFGDIFPILFRKKEVDWLALIGSLMAPSKTTNLSDANQFKSVKQPTNINLLNLPDAVNNYIRILPLTFLVKQSSG